MASGVVHFLDTEKTLWKKDATTLRLYCDGCGGQNKNQHVIHALAHWLSNDTGSVNTIELVFPVRGHSRLPADRVFGRVEQELRKTKDIHLPKDYLTVYGKHGLVRQLGRDWKIRNFKLYAAYMKSLSGIQACKRIVLKKQKNKVVFKMELNYFSSDRTKGYTDIMKVPHKISSLLLPPVVNDPIPLNAATKKDLKYLLANRFGDDWATNTGLKFYVDVLALESPAEVDGDGSALEYECNCMDDDAYENKL